MSPGGGIAHGGSTRWGGGRPIGAALAVTLMVIVSSGAWATLDGAGSAGHGSSVATTSSLPPPGSSGPLSVPTDVGTAESHANPASAVGMEGAQGQQSGVHPPATPPVARPEGSGTPGTGVALLQPLAGPSYDTQEGTTFVGSFSTVNYTVSAVEQTDGAGYGPGYLVNGLTPAGYWYQAGLGWYWPYESGGVYGASEGFYLLYEVFNSTGASIFPAGGGGGALPFTGPVLGNDSVDLSLTFTGGNVTMAGVDEDSGSTASVSYSAEGSALFVGSSTGEANSNGFFTGLMTEEYVGSLPWAAPGQVPYVDQGAVVDAAWLWMDAFAVPSGATQWDSFASAPASLGTSPVLTGWDLLPDAVVRENVTLFESGYQVAYAVQFVQSGVPGYESFIANFGGSGWFSGFPLTAPNGTYLYYALPFHSGDTEYRAAPDGGTATVSGSPITIRLHYIPTQVGNLVAGVPTYAPDGTAFSVFDPANNNFYITQVSGSNVTVLNATTLQLVGNVTLGTGSLSGPWAIAYDPEDRDVYVTLDTLSEVAVISSRTEAVVKYIPVGANPDAITYDPEDHDVYVGNAGFGSTEIATNNVTVINGGTAKVIRYLPIHNGQDGIGVDTADDRLYLDNFFSSTVTVLNASSNGFVANITLPPGPAGSIPAGGPMAYDPYNHEMYITNWTALPEFSGPEIEGYFDNGASVWAFSGTQLVANIPVGVDPVSVVVDGNNGLVYVDSFTDGWLAAINQATDQNIFAAPPGGLPSDVYFLGYSLGSAAGIFGMSFDPDGHVLVVPNRNSDTVGVLVTPYKVTFEEQSEAGLAWSVDLGGYARSAVALRIGFYEQDGSYAFTIKPPKGFRALPASGEVVVDGANVVVTVTFEPKGGSSAVAGSGTDTLVVVPQVAAMPRWDRLGRPSDPGPG